LEYHEVKGGKYERVNSLTEKDLDERDIRARVYRLVAGRPSENRLEESPEEGTQETPVPAEREEVTAVPPEQPATVKPAYGADNKLAGWQEKTPGELEEGYDSSKPTHTEATLTRPGMGAEVDESLAPSKEEVKAEGPCRAPAYGANNKLITQDRTE